MWQCTGKRGSPNSVIDEDKVQDMIDAAVAGMDNVLYAADIAARDALVLTANAKVYVADASADATVTSGGATYFYYHATTTFIKTSEEESLEIEVTWAALSGKPSSSVADIDDAVSKTLGAASSSLTPFPRRRGSSVSSSPTRRASISSRAPRPREATPSPPSTPSPMPRCPSSSLDRQ